MLVKMHNVLELIGRRIRASRINWGSGLRKDEGIKVAWAKRIASFGEIPEIYKGYFESHRSNDQSIPYTVLVPGFEILGHTIAEKLISAFEREIHVLERRRDAFSVQCFPINNISYMEMRTVLLYSHIKISGITSTGAPANAVIQFNSVTDHLFIPILNRVRQGPADMMKAVEGSGSNEFDHWSNLNFKFMNYARRSVMGGEKVIRSLLQPEIRESRFSFLGKIFFRMIFPTHAIILTERELIAIREEAIQGRKDKYGGTWVYIPLDKITAVALTAVNDELLSLSIQLPEKERFEYLFEAARKAEVGQLLERLEELTLVYGGDGIQ